MTTESKKQEFTVAPFTPVQGFADFFTVLFEQHLVAHHPMLMDLPLLPRSKFLCFVGFKLSSL